MQKRKQLRLASIRAADPSDPGGVGYGYGIAELGSYLFHDGGVPGYSSWMASDPDTATTIVVLAGLVFAPDGSAVAVELAEAAADGLPAG